MVDRSVRTEEDLRQTINTYADDLYRICFTMLRNSYDAEDIVQDTFIKYYQSDKKFESDRHKKSWLIKVALNECRDKLRFWKRHSVISLEEYAEIPQSPDQTESKDILEALMRLPLKYKIVMTLFYAEEYSVKEIAEMLHTNESVVKKRLQKGRKLLRDIYREEYEL